MSYKISFEGHRGLLFSLDQSVIFYGVRFSGILDAVKFLKDLKPGGFYEPWCYGNTRGVKDLQTQKIYILNRWMDSEKTAELYLKVCR